MGDCRPSGVWHGALRRINSRRREYITTRLAIHACDRNNDDALALACTPDSDLEERYGAEREHELREMAEAVAEAKVAGVNPRTASKDAFALREFELLAKLKNIDPNLRTEWTRRFPERESLKLSYFLLFRSQRIQPRAKGDVAARPMSVYQNYMAIRRVFRQRGQELPPSGACSTRRARGSAIRRAVRRFGIEWLRPQRIEPVTTSMILRCVCVFRQGTSTIAGLLWTEATWTAFIITCTDGDKSLGGLAQRRID